MVNLPSTYQSTRLWRLSISALFGVLYSYFNCFLTEEIQSHKRSSYFLYGSYQQLLAQDLQRPSSPLSHQHQLAGFCIHPCSCQIVYL